MRRILSILVLALMVITVSAQEQKEVFKPSGKAFVKVFTNYHTTFNGEETHNAFEIQRAYFGYGFKLSKKFSGKVTLDVGNPGGTDKLQMTAYLKNAYMQYKSGKFTAKFGMIGLNQFKLQENQWGNRYLYKSFQDQYKFGSSADLGVALSYQVLSFLSLDAGITNGDGYKNVESDSILKYNAGLTVKPFKGFDFRLYWDAMGNEDVQQSLSFYTGYSRAKFKLGAEYNQQLNNKMKMGNDFSGYSFYGSYKASKLIRVFGRFDQLSSVVKTAGDDPWNFAKDGQAILIGLELNPVKGIKVTPNYQGWLPADGGSIINGAYLSCEIKI